MDALSNERLLTVGDVAALAQVSKRQVWRLRDAGQLPMPVRVGSQIRWRRSEILEWMANGCPVVDGPAVACRATDSRRVGDDSPGDVMRKGTSHAE